ncbi:MAG: response regulator [Defluviitaleaceae bacterium]|nr:response regulator [Defluviitaleaceae bacterium]
MYKVLFVEDEAVMRMAFHKMMDWNATEFTLASTVSNGAEALSYAAENHIDIVVTDLKMPVMDGIELIQSLRARGFSGVILVLSNYTDFELVRQALTKGAADYMLKLDIDGDTLLKQLNAAAALLKNETGTPRDIERYRHCKKEVRDALVFIHQSFTEKITLDDVAKAVNLNRSYLCRLFKQETGGHMFGYLNDLRMKKAAALIEEGIEAGDVYIREVASAVGIDDQFYFARVFKKYHKMPPSEYVKHIKDKISNGAK